jgi:ribosomal protein L37AE/L43A
MSRTVTDTLIRSPCTAHTAELSGNGWTVTWLPGRILTRSQAEAAMNIAEELGAIPAGADPEDDDVLWDCINGWAADLGLSGRDAVARVSEPPDERRAIPGCPQCGATAPRIAWIGWTGTDDPDVSQPADVWQCTDCGQKWETGPQPR